VRSLIQRHKAQLSARERLPSHEQAPQFQQPQRSLKVSFMIPVTLYRTDPARNLWRFYHLDVQPDLFGAWCFVREWGRIGQAGQTRIVPYPTPDAAQAAFS
jgi:predicted DNA-binding WGR domain protein